MFRSNLLWMRLPWDCHNQPRDTNWRHSVTGLELPFFHKRKGVLKIDQSVKMPWHRLSIRVTSSCWSAPEYVYYTRLHDWRYSSLIFWFYYAIVKGMDELYWDSGITFLPIITFLPKEDRGLASKFLLLSKWRFFSVNMLKIIASCWSKRYLQCHH